MSVLYFAYGSNLDQEQMRARCPGSEPLARARLGGYQLGFTWYSTRWSGGAADIVLATGIAEVWGALYRMGDGDFERLDRFEGGYDRLRVAVELDGGRTTHAVTYAVREKGEFAPHAVYVDKMLRWGTHWELPENYLADLRLREVVRPK